MPRRGAGTSEGRYDEKNIRRRVYDALNVLMAIGAIAKEGKDIVWQGWPRGLGGSAAPADAAAAQRARIVRGLEEASEKAAGMLAKSHALANLILHNRDMPLAGLEALREAGVETASPLPLPFVLVQVS